MWLVCRMMHEMSSFIFSENNNKNHFKVSSAVIMFSALRIEYIHPVMQKKKKKKKKVC